MKLRQFIVGLLFAIVTEGLVFAASPSVTYGPSLFIGPLTVAGVAPPNLVSVYSIGSNNGQTYCYKITSISGTGQSLATSEYCTTRGAATLSPINASNLSWSTATGANHYDVYGRTSGAEQFLSSCPGGIGCNGSLAFVDDGSLTPTTSPPTVDTTSTVTGNLQAGGASVIQSAFVHSQTTSGTLTCTATSGSNPVLDIFTGTISGSTVSTVPGSNCADKSQVQVWAFQPSGNNNYTTSFANNGSNTLYIIASNDGVLLPLGTSTGNWVEYILQYDAASTTWNITGQTSFPAPTFPYDLHFSIAGSILSNQIVPDTEARTIIFPANLSGTQVTCGTNPGETDAYTLKVAGSSVATLTLSTSCVLTLSLQNPFTATAGQRVELDAPGTVSGANIAFVIPASR